MPQQALSTGVLNAAGLSMSAIRRFLKDEAGHEYVDLNTAWRWELDVLEVYAHCSGCKRKWTHQVPTHVLYGSLGRASYGMYEENFVKAVVPFITKISDIPCLLITLEAELAEWVTLRLAEAEPEGLPYPHLIQEAVDKHVCTPQDVDTTLRRLGFLNEWTPIRPILPHQVAAEVLRDPEWTTPVLRLPEVHPLRKESV